MHLVFGLLCLLGSVWSLTAATINTPCNFLSISNAICVTAQEGDLVLIGPGDCIISNTINIRRGRSFTIAGSGTNATTLRSRPGLFNAFGITAISTGTLTFSNFNAIGAYNDSGFISVGNNVPGTPLTGLTRISHVRMTNVMNVGLAIGYCDSWTVVDHCTFFTVDGGSGSWNPIQFYGNQYRSWTNLNDNPLGTTRCSVVEDCYFKNNSSSGGNGFFDGYNGMQAVVRHCYFDGNAYTGCHGYDSQVTSMRTLEVYNNTFTNITSALCLSRGGVFLFYSNEVWKADNNSIGPKLTYYRAVPVVPMAFGFAGYDMTNTYRTNWLDGDRESIGSTLYVFKADISGFRNAGGYVELGKTLAETLTNLTAAINCDPSSAGITYTAITTNLDVYGKRNSDFRVIQNTDTSLVLRNIMDGPNPYGWPAAMQAGVLSITRYTNSPIRRFPCYSWSNTVHYANGSKSLAAWQLDFETETNQPNYVTKLMQEGRDYFNNVIPDNYQPLSYPYPVHRISRPQNVNIADP